VKPLCGTAAYTASDACCGSTVYATSTHFCTRSVTSSPRVVPLCGGRGYDTRTKFCYNNSKVGDFCGTRTETFDPDLYECRENKKIYLKTPVSYGSENYEAVLIGTQTWLARNLNYSTTNSKCYGNNAASCDEYGRLYDWATAKTICPDGWHLPSAEEWTALQVAWTNLMANNALWSVNNGTDDYGFSALPGGYGSSKYGGFFGGIRNYGFWWSATEYNASNAHYELMFCQFASEYADTDKSSNFYSVRCVQD